MVTAPFSPLLIVNSKPFALTRSTGVMTAAVQHANAPVMAPLAIPARHRLTDRRRWSDSYAISSNCARPEPLVDRTPAARLYRQRADALAQRAGEANDLVADSCTAVSERFENTASATILRPCRSDGRKGRGGASLNAHDTVPTRFGQILNKLLMTG